MPRLSLAEGACMTDMPTGAACTWRLAMLAMGHACCEWRCCLAPARHLVPAALQQPSISLL
jgi:hypothetical protein